MQGLQEGTCDQNVPDVEVSSPVAQLDVRVDPVHSTFNKIIPQPLIEKLSLLGLNTSLCNWILDFLTGRPQTTSQHTEVQQLKAWCKANNLFLNVDKTKEMVVDFRRVHSGNSPLFIDESSVEIEKSTKLHLAENFTWSLNTSSISKKAQQ
ncbi:hypothetical protein QTP70_033619 [Hemibagrus guttatus]|uniref:Uncharacterized protein n=1 Tax=Hemibagrus guttatus TaxID=175788 RepID=A0AAE0UNK2_9TELE|nr:hypothetical protein QTP70_033619 [Hemibagrus guttatus]